MPGVDFFPPIFPDDAVELFGSDDGCSQRIYSSTGIPFGASTHQYVHVRVENNNIYTHILTQAHILRSYL